MKILQFLSSPAPGGAEIYVRDLCIHMARQGHNILIVFLTDAKSIGRDIAFEKNFIKELNENNIKHEILGTRSKKDLVLNFFRVKNILKKFKPDIMHAHFHYAMFYLGAFSSKVIYTHHNIVPGAPTFLFKLYNIRVSEYIGISKKCKEVLEQYTGKKVTRIDNAVDKKRVVNSGMSKNKKGENLVTLVASGRLVYAKNYEMLMEAAANLKEMNKNFKVVVAGEGKKEYKMALEKKLLEYDLGDNFKFIGQCNDIPELLNSADIFVMTSHYEGLPISLLEASLLGLPAIVTDVGSCAEVVETCKSGYIVKAGNAQEFAEKCDELINDSELRKRFSESALKLSAHYEIKRSVSEHLTLYHKVSGED